MTDNEKQELNGRLYAQELILNVLLTDYLTRMPDKRDETEHLEALVGGIQQSFQAQAGQMSTISRNAAERTILELLGASRSLYWK